MKKPFNIAIIDYRISNMFSIQNALGMLGFNCEVTSNRSKILASDGAILPGVGSFPEAMKHIVNLGVDETITEFIDTGKPFMGICLGFQLLFDKSSEIKVTSGLGVIAGEVKNFIKQEKRRVPHIGWNSVKKNPLINNRREIDSRLNLNDGEQFYFVHSCYVSPENKNDIYTTTEYSGDEFCSSILKENIFACQFHPEKSGENGVQVLNKMFTR